MSSVVVSCAVVPDDERLQFLPEFFGPRLFMQGESAVYDTMKGLNPEYTGGYWDFFTLNGTPAFMALRGSEQVKLTSPNGFETTLAPDAAGIVVCLFVLSEMSFEALGSDQDLICERFHALRDYASEHAQASKIFALID